MIYRADGNIRVGCGRYDWHVNDDVAAEQIKHRF